MDHSARLAVRHGDDFDVPTAATALAIALLALNVLDLVITRVAIEHLGAIELNPVMAPTIGTVWATALKVLIPLVVVALASRVRYVAAVHVLRGVVALYLAITIFTLGQVTLALA